jgi:hypothetical protein
MMKRTLAWLLILCILLPLPLFSDPLPTYAPYEQDEFPLWTYKIRRAETLFFGSMVITLPVSALLYRLALSSNILPAQEDALSDLLVQASIAATLSLGISVADYVIGEIGGS